VFWLANLYSLLVHIEQNGDESPEDNYFSFNVRFCSYLTIQTYTVEVVVIGMCWTGRCLHIYLLTPWSRVFLEELTGFHPVKKFHTFHGTRRLITAFTSARHLSLSWTSSIQSIPSTCHFLKIHLNIILPSTPWSPKRSLSLRFTHQTLYTPLLFPICATCPAHLILDFITRTVLGEEYRSLSSSLCSFLHSPVTSFLLGPNIRTVRYLEGNCSCLIQVQSRPFPECFRM